MKLLTRHPRKEPQPDTRHSDKISQKCYRPKKKELVNTYKFYWDKKEEHPTNINSGE
jgi:hypothetical protein